MKRQYILWAIASIFLCMQFFSIDTFNPPVDPNIDFPAAANPPAEILSMVKDACYDCHSSQTEYPWYSQVAPVSWWIKHHVDEGIEHFNFNTLGALSRGELAEALGNAAEVVRKEEMPLSSYTWMHPKARLSPEQRNTLSQWLASYGKIEERYGTSN